MSRLASFLKRKALAVESSAMNFSSLGLSLPLSVKGSLWRYYQKICQNTKSFGLINTSMVFGPQINQLKFTFFLTQPNEVSHVVDQEKLFPGSYHLHDNESKLEVLIAYLFVVLFPD